MPLRLVSGTRASACRFIAPGSQTSAAARIRAAPPRIPLRRNSRGRGRALVLDGLQWLTRRGAGHALVNTQEGNDGALHVYRSLGFHPEPDGLDVLAAALR